MRIQDCQGQPPTQPRAEPRLMAATTWGYGQVTEQEGRRSWSFLSNHTHVMVCLGQNPDSRLRDVAERVGITERATQRIISELVEAGFVTRIRDGRRNRYRLHTDAPLRRRLGTRPTVGQLLALFGAGD